jgi:Zn-dependent protease/predicted transcriptional regulator
MFSARIPLFTLLGFRINIDASWFLLAFLMVWTLSTGQFPRAIPGLDSLTYFIMGAIGALGLFASIVLHELSHAIVARAFGLPIGGITLFIFGGVAELQDEPKTPRAEFWVAIAGPIASVLIAALCYFGAEGARSLFWAHGFVVLSFLAVVNTILALFNLVPAFPLDGGRILRSILWWRNGDLRRSTRIASYAGTGFAIALMALGVLQLLTGNPVGGTWQILIGFFLSNAARQARLQVEFTEGLRNVPVSRLMNANPVTVPPDATLQSLVDDYIYRHRQKLFVVAEDGHAIGCIAPEQVKAIPSSEWGQTYVRAMMRPIGPKMVASPETSALNALQRLQANDAPLLAVVEGNRLLGLITRRDILDYLSVSEDMEPRSAPSRRTAPPPETP